NNTNSSSTFSLVGAEESADTTPPVITTIANNTPTTDSVTITWYTDEDSDSRVKYGNMSGNYTMQEFNTTLVTTHSITVTGLTSDTTYYFVVNSTDASENSNESIESSFMTAAAADTTPPVITNIANNTPTTDSVTLTWYTDEDSDSRVKYGNMSGNYTMQEFNTTLVTT
ncbi:MAG: fibronectin type III domain-containing protein, partial [Candidatus Thorarchaeota archaeon]|nr:fibronectin type III domain-containing protein [Candidatus Thorarchaeota archaeon]